MQSGLEFAILLPSERLKNIDISHHTQLEGTFHRNPAARNPLCVLRPFVHLNVSTKLYPALAVEMWLFVYCSFWVLKFKELGVS